MTLMHWRRGARKAGDGLGLFLLLWSLIFPLTAAQSAQAREVAASERGGMTVAPMGVSVIVIARRLGTPGIPSAGGGGGGDAVTAPLNTLPRKENGSSITWDAVNDKPAEDMTADWRTLPDTTGWATHAVTSTATWNTAIGAISGTGDVIKITAGTVITAQTTLTSKANVLIVADDTAFGNLPAIGTRLGTADAANCYTIRSTTTNGIPLSISSNCSNIRVVGAIFTNESGTNNADTLVSTAATWTTQAAAPHHITLDRCHFKAQTSAFQRRGLLAAGEDIVAVDCRFSSFHDSGSDSQAVWAFKYLRRLHLDNCYLDGAAENFMTGGSDQPAIDGSLANSWPTDFMITRCEFYKSGDPASQLQKNLFEIKNGEYGLIWGCVLHKFRTDAQSAACNIQTNNQGNTAGYADYSKCSNWTVRGNKFYDCNGYILAITRNNGTNVTTGTRYIEFSYNLIYDMAAGSNNRCYFMADSGVCPEVSVFNNTFVYGNAANVYFTSGTGGTYLPLKGPQVFNNVFSNATTYDYLVGNLNSLFGTDNWRFDNNLSVGGSVTSGGTPGNTGANANISVANTAAIKFTDEANDNYLLASDSPGKNAGSDGRDMGAAIALLDINTAGVETG